jgi:hypothetical protein
MGSVLPCCRTGGRGRLVDVGQQTVPRCPCCGYRTGCGTCPVCYWTSGGQGGGPSDAATDGVNVRLTLAVARLNFRIYGASLPRYQDLVRPPRRDEWP